MIIDKPDPKTGQLNLMPRYFFLVTNWPEDQRPGEGLLAHYRRRGTFEDRLGEFNAAIGCRLSSPNFAKNEVTLLLGLLAFNLSCMMRNEFEDALGSCWDLSRFQQSVLRTAARITKRSRRLVLHIEESVRTFWQIMSQRIRQLRLASLWPVPRGSRSLSYTPPPPHAHQRLVLRDCPRLQSWRMPSIPFLHSPNRHHAPGGKGAVCNQITKTSSCYDILHPRDKGPLRKRAW